MIGDATRETDRSTEPSTLSVTPSPAAMATSTTAGTRQVLAQQLDGAPRGEGGGRGGSLHFLF